MYLRDKKLKNKDTKGTFLSLVRSGIGHTASHLPKEIDWNITRRLAEEQGLSAIVLDGIDRLPTDNRPSQKDLLDWIGDVLQNYENRYEQYCKSVSDLASLYGTHGFRMMVLKGYACSLNWPKPNHRPCGDIDIWLFGRQKEADSILANKNNIIIDNGHHHHTVFNWRNFTVENHFDFVNVYAHKSSKRLEKLFKEHGQDDTYYIELYGNRVYLPSPNLHALFLIRHLQTHFAAEGATLRQLMDWGFFVKHYKKDVDWSWLEGVLSEYGMMDVYNIFNAICVEDLGFSSDLFTRVQFNPDLKDRVLDDIITPEYSLDLPNNLVKRALYKYRRWKGNAWKRSLCYKESSWCEFWTGLWGHLVKPSSF